MDASIPSSNIKRKNEDESESDEQQSFTKQPTKSLQFGRNI